MSHRNPKERSSKRSGSQYPSAWSAWAWNDQHQCDVRYRLIAPNEYEYEYGPVGRPEDPRSISDVLDTIPEQQYSSQNFTTASVETITRELAGTSLFPSTIQQPQVSQEYTGHTSAGYQAHIATRNPNTSKEKFDPNYKVHGGHEFEWGRVFKVLWAEPKGNNGSNAGDSEYSEREGKHGEKFHEKVRRFVIIDRRKGHCICLPIMTYGGQGTNKWGVHANDHAVIWTDKPVQFAGEAEKGLTRKPVRVSPNNKRHKLDAASRLNYAKLYTVEYNVKVWFIGRIHRDSEYQLTADYNDVHPPMKPRGVPPSTADTISYTGGAASGYPTTYSTYPAPASSYLTSTTTYPTMPSSSTASYSSAEYQTSTTQYSNVNVGPSYRTEEYERSTDPSTEPSTDPPTEPSYQPPNPYDQEKYYDQ